MKNQDLYIHTEIYKGVKIHNTIGDWSEYSKIYIDEIISSGEEVGFTEIYYFDERPIIKLLDGKFQIDGEDDFHDGLNEAIAFIKTMAD